MFFLAAYICLTMLQKKYLKVCLCVSCLKVQRKRMLREAFAILKDPSIEEEDDK